jgi:hypothetical protein
MLDELSTFFAPGSQYHNCRLDQLEALARAIYDRYMTTGANHKTHTAPSLANTSVHDIIQQHLQRSDLAITPSASPSNNHTSGVQMLGNLTLLMRDMFLYLEFATAIPEGDVGRVFEVMKVSICAF